MHLTPHDRRHAMPFHRTLIATVVAAGTIAAALSFAHLDGAEPPSPPQAGPATVATADPGTTVSTTAAPAATFAPVAPPTVSTPSAPSTLSTLSGVPAVASAPVEIPAAAEPLDVALAPVGADTFVATGSEAATWLEAAPPEVVEAVAVNLDTTPEELGQRFTDDPSAFLSADGMAGYIEPTPDNDAHADEHNDAGAHAHTDAATDATPEPEPVAANGSTPVDVFALHSLPTSTKVVYLDFDGYLMQNEYWNSAYSIGPFTNQPYDIDGDPTAFSDTERARILEIWQLVADDYAPFDIDVTTEDPGIDGLRRTGTSDTTYGTRTVITSSDWFAAANSGRRIGGIALVNVFTSNTARSSFVFSSNLGGGRAKYVADAASHEAGHTLSLLHDGTASSDYYGGHGAWGPIMGAPYSRAVTQWSKGQYTSANNVEDDLDKIGARGGLRTDDHANTAAGATAVSAGTHRGVVGVGGDIDTFRVTPAGGDTRITVTTPPPATNLLARFTVRNSDGNVVATVDPTVASSWSLTTVVPAAVGTFTVEITGTSWLTSATGFVSYGSLGAYTLDIAALPAPSTTSSTTTSTSTTTTTSPTTTTSSTTTSTSSTTSTSAPTTTAVTATSTSAPPTAPPVTSLPSTFPPSTPPAVAPRAGGLPLTAIEPQRLLDTRSGLGGSTRLAADSVVRIPIAGRGGIPGDARAAVVNLTVVEPDTAGYATIYPCSAQVPDVSVLNYAPSQTVANNTIATLSSSGDVCVYTWAAVDVLLDVTGWLGPSAGSRMVPLGPTRSVDTRSGLGGSGRVAAGSVTRFDLTAAVGPQSTAVAVNLTALAPGSAGYMTAYPCNRGRPATSSVNFAAGETRPNNAIVATDDDSICVYSDTEADILLDVTASFGPNGFGLEPVDPVRLFDTRRGTPFSNSEIRSYSVGGSQLGSTTPRSASVNVTALDQPAPGFVTTFDCVTLRETSTLNPSAGTISANGAIVPVAEGDRSCLLSSSGGNLIVDLNGWWVP